jgi:hypothetical protein
MSELNNPAIDESQPKLRRSDGFGKNALGFTCIAPDFYEDIPLGFLLGEDGPAQTCGGNEDGG